MRHHKITDLAEGTRYSDAVNLSQLGNSHITSILTNNVLEYVMKNSSNIVSTNQAEITVEKFTSYELLMFTYIYYLCCPVVSTMLCHWAT